MLSSIVEGVLKNIDSGDVTELFLWGMAGVLGFALYQARKSAHSRFLEYAPTLLTTLGILGTFMGVVIGLLHFDTSSIDKSIPALLDGLKTAFITSIAGMVAAIIFNAVDAFWFADKRELAMEPTDKDVTPNDIHAALTAQSELLGKIALGLTGSEEGSLVGQLKLLRSEVSDFSRAQRDNQLAFSDRLWGELDRFADMMSKAATEQIIDALRQVIVDFNNKLTEQFGDNFKALDASVKKLVDWQQTYKDQVEKMGAQYEQSVESLVETRQAVAGIWQECKEIPVAMSDLREVLLVNQHQIAELQRHLEAFVTMRDKAIEAVPNIQQKIEEVGELMKLGAQGLSDSLDKTGAQLLTNSNEMRVALEEGAEQFRDSVLHTQQSFNKMASDVSSSSEELSTTLGDTVKDMKASATDLLANMRGSVDELASKLLKHSSELSIQLQQDVDGLAGKLAKHNSDLNGKLDQYASDMTSRFTQSATSFEQSAGRIVEQLGQSGDKAQRQVASNVEGMMEELTGSMTKARTQLDGHITDALKTFGADINKKLETFETGTMRELNSELETMGKALTSITSRFVDDYRRLVASMDEVIRRQLTKVI